MALRVNQNVLSIRTHGVLSATSNRLEKSIEKLSSGLRINRAADDAAGLAISEKLRRQLRGLSRAILNAQDGISMIQTAEGALNESQNILQRMRELALQSCNDTLTSNDRLEIQKEVNQLRDDLNRIARNTEFNTKKLIDGSQTALISASSSSVRGMVVGLGDTGGDYEVSITLLGGGITQMLRTQIFTLKDDASILAKGTTQLTSIAQFYDSNGVFVLDNPQIFTINGNSKSTNFTLDGQMTLDKLAASIQNALVSIKGLEIENSRVGMVNTSQTNVSGLGGYIEIVSGMIGEEGEIAFSSDQALLSSIGLAVTRESKNNLVELTLNDTMGNTTKVRTEANRAPGLLEGIDLQFTSQAAQMAGTQGLEEGLYLSGNETFTISAGGVEVIVSAASGYWTMEGLARNIDVQIGTAGTNIRGLSAAVVEGELRLTYEKPATAAATIGTTIEISNATGAATLGFLNGAFSGFADAKKDTTKVQWGLTKYRTDVASGDITSFLIGDGLGTVQIDVYTAQGNASGSLATPDMLSFTLFQSTANEQLFNATVRVRIDQVLGAMAFTSLRIGRENLDNAAPNSSVVTLSITTSSTLSAGDSLISQLGLNEGTAKGSGDKNFRVHVVENAPQFQIGADQGQIMNISMSDLTAEAMDVDNLDMTSIRAATISLGKINKAIDIVSAERSKLGAFQNRLEYAINNLRSANTNMVAAESRIRDADIAMEMIEFTRNQIVSQSGTAMLAQANLIPSGVLQLLK